MNNQPLALVRFAQSALKTIAKKKSALFTLLTVVIFVFPVSPLILASLWGLKHIVPGIFSGNFFHLDQFFNIELLLTLWADGGLAGLIAVIQVLRSKYTKTTFALYLYAAIAYTLIAVVFITDLMHKGTFESISTGFYVMVSVLVIGIQMVRLHNKVFSKINATGDINMEKLDTNSDVSRIIETSLSNANHR